MPKKEDYKAMHDDAMSILDVANRMSRFSANHLAIDDDEDEEMEDDEDEEVSKKLRKKMILKKLKRMSK